MIRLLCLPLRDADTLYEALKARMADLPATLLWSITWDQGLKWSVTSRSPINRQAGTPRLPLTLATPLE